MYFNNGVGATAIAVGKSEGFHIHPIAESDMNFSDHPGYVIHPFGIYPFSQYINIYGIHSAIFSRVLIARFIILKKRLL